MDVVIPVHNRHTVVRQALSSLTAQTRPPNNVILVDDGSDPPIDAGLLRDHSLNGSTVRIESKSGAGHARNIGVRESTAKIVLFLDSDDLFHPRTIELVDQTHRDPSIYASYPRVVSTDGGVVVGRSPCPDFSDVRLSLAYRNYVHSVSGFAIERRLFDRVGGFDESLRIGEDLDFYFRMFSTSPKDPHPIPYYLVHRRISPDSLTSRLIDWAHDCDQLHRSHLAQLETSQVDYHAHLAQGFIRRMERLHDRANDTAARDPIRNLLYRARSDFQTQVTEDLCSKLDSHPERCNQATFEQFIAENDNGRPLLIAHLDNSIAMDNGKDPLCSQLVDSLGDFLASSGMTVLGVALETDLAADDRVPLSVLALRMAAPFSILWHRPSACLMRELMKRAQAVLTTKREFAAEVKSGARTTILITRHGSRPVIVDADVPEANTASGALVRSMRL